nr:structural protein [Tolivirales sp.]
MRRIQYIMPGQKKRNSGKASTGGASAQAIVMRGRTAKLPVVGSHPSSFSKSTRTMTVKRCEVVSAIQSTATTYALTSSLTPSDCLIHPGNERLFPWLSGIADSYEKYRFDKLVFRLISANPSTASGMVYLAVDTDPTDPQPTSISELMSNAYSASGTVWNNVALVVDCNSLNSGLPFRFTRARGSDNTIEPRTAYAGQILVAGSGTTGATFNLEVDYAITLAIEQLPLAIPQLVTTTQPGGVSPRSLTATSGPLAVVVEGSQGVPQFSGTDVGYLNRPSPAIDLGNLQRGLMSLVIEASKTATTPLTMFINAIPDILAFNDQGVQVSTLGDMVTSLWPYTRGAATGMNLSNAGDTGSASTAFSLPDWKAVRPLIRYLVPILRGLPSEPTATSFRFKYET